MNNITFYNNYHRSFFFQPQAFLKKKSRSYVQSKAPHFPEFIGYSEVIVGSVTIVFTPISSPGETLLISLNLMNIFKTRPGLFQGSLDLKSSDFATTL